MGWHRPATAANDLAAETSNVASEADVQRAVMRYLRAFVDHDNSDRRAVKNIIDPYKNNPPQLKVFQTKSLKSCPKGSGGK